MKKYIYLAGLLVILAACDITDKTNLTLDEYSISLISSYNISVPEPSGLSFDPTSNSLWTVSDENGKIYQLELNGDVIQSLEFQGSDLEGIAMDPIENCLWVVEEEQRNLVQISMIGNEMGRFPQLIPGYDNSGLEGVCLDAASNLFLLKEKNPGQFIQLKSDKSIKEIIELDFAGDYSGIVAADADKFWILSDQAETIFLWSAESGVNLELPVSVDKPEGIAFDSANRELYIISDSENKLYHYQLIQNSASL